jgi:hypothetical protein
MQNQMIPFMLAAPPDARGLCMPSDPGQHQNISFMRARGRTIICCGQELYWLEEA